MAGPEPVVIAPPGWPAIPERTIAADAAEWAAKWVTQPDGPDAGKPWSFTDQQLRILAYWFAYDEAGRWLYRRGTVRMMKGWGKDPFVAVLAAIELLGPCRVQDGKAVRHPSPWVQIAAVSRDQTRTTMRLFPAMLPPKTLERYSVEVNKEVIYANGGRGVIEAVTSSPDSLEGGRATLVIRNETQYWRKANQGHDMAEVIDGNLAKSRDGAARALSVCNAHVPGEDTVGEREWDAYQAVQAGRTRTSDILYVAVEAPPSTRLDDEESLKHGLAVTRGDSTWLDVDRLAAEVWDPRTTPSEARRKYLNQVVAAEDAYLAPHEWDACKKDVTLADGEMVTLGFDGSKTDDHTALVATRIEDGATFVLDVWDPERHRGEIPRQAVDAAVAKAFDRFDVVGFYSDLHPFESYVDAWAQEYGDGLCVNATTDHPIAWDMRSREKAFTRAAERLHDAVTEGAFIHNGDARLREHALNARRRPNRHGVSFGKEHRESARKVDALAAAVLARLAWLDYLALPPSKQRKRKRGGAAFY
jgi:phage terminase large subunit-like protein